jgi:type I restriction enzyme S subunit
MKQSHQNGFQQVSLGELCETGSGGTPSRQKAAEYFGGTIPWVKSGELRENVITSTEESITDIGLKESAAKLLPRNTLLVALYGATVGRIGVLGIEAATNQAVCYIIPDERRVNRQFLFYALRVQVPFWLSKRVGGGQPNISQGIIKETKIPLPPLPEQRRIADILDKADAIRRKRRKAVEEVTTFSFSVFHEMFGEPRCNPHNWPSSPLSALVREDDKINYGVVQPGEDFPGGIPLVRVGDFKRMKIDKANIKRIDPEIEASYKRSRLVGDEVLLACVGSIGLVALADESLRGFNTVRAVARIRCGPKLNRHYLAYYISTPFLQSFFLQSTRTVSQPTLNIGLIEETNVLVPPIALQNRFAAILAKHQETANRFDESANGTEQLFNSLVQRAFRGEL